MTIMTKVRAVGLIKYLRHYVIMLDRNLGRNDNVWRIIERRLEVVEALNMEERAAEFDGKLMLDGEYDWGEPVGREVW